MGYRQQLIKQKFCKKIKIILKKLIKVAVYNIIILGYIVI